MKSMTGFGRAERAVPSGACSVELSSVNRKNLDLQIAVPRSCAAIETEVARKLREACARGRVQLRISIESDAKTGSHVLDPERLSLLLASVNDTAERLGLAPVDSMSDLLRIPGATASESAAATLEEDLASEVLAAVDDAVAALLTMREAEGRALCGILSGQAGRMRELADSLVGKRAIATERLRSRLLDGLQELGVEGLQEDPRLLQEIAFYAEKADICEEVDRLRSHLDQLDEKLRVTEPVGRALDFLGQEIGREVNTICSKSQDLEVTRTALALKELVDQFREQSLNVE